MEPLQFYILNSVVDQCPRHFLDLSADGANLVTMVVVVEISLVKGLLLEVVSDDKSQFDEEMYGIVECCPAHPEEVMLHLGTEFLQGEMPVHVVNGIEYGKPFRGLPAIVLLQIVGQREPYSLQNIVIHQCEGVACELQN